VRRRRGARHLVHFTFHIHAGCVFFGAAERGSRHLARIVGRIKRLDLMAKRLRAVEKHVGCTRRTENSED
jgi:hypothetical protein